MKTQKCKNCWRDIEFREGVIMKLCRCGMVIEKDTLREKENIEVEGGKRK